MRNCGSFSIAKEGLVLKEIKGSGFYKPGRMKKNNYEVGNGQ